MEIERFDYHLPASKIAKYPSSERTASRLLIVNPDDQKFDEIRFSEIATLVRPGDVMVGNDTRVIPARLAALKPTGGKVEIMLERILSDSTALVQLGSNKPVRDQQLLYVGQCEFRVLQRRGSFFVIQCEAEKNITSLFESLGSLPLPPYIDRPAELQDRERYQTVYSSETGAVAAPTAGLHFDQALISHLRERGVDWATVTLHVGAGTFQPVRTETLEAHHMHRERIEVDQRVCDQINEAISAGGRVIAVGTTVVRALESASESGSLQPFSGDTELFILPGYRFRVVDALITNFHLPRSTLLMMVCAFAGYENIMRAYEFAINHDFRFYSYGDAMFVERLCQ